MCRWISEYRTACSDRMRWSAAATARLLCFSGAEFTEGLAQGEPRVGDGRLLGPPGGWLSASLFPTRPDNGRSCWSVLGLPTQPAMWRGQAAQPCAVAAQVGLVEVAAVRGSASQRVRGWARYGEPGAEPLES